MPKLLIFAPCEKIIIDPQGNASLIVLLQTLTASPIAQAQMPADAVAPKEWAVFTMWQTLPEESGQDFVQIFQMLWPNKSEFKKVELPFKVQADRIQQTTMNIIGFPIGQLGTCTVNLWLEQNAKKVTETYSYPINVLHGKPTEVKV